MVTRKDIVYKSIDGIDLKLDLYYPASYGNPSHLPAVIFAHGEAPWEILHNAKDWGQYKGWGQLVAASGMVAITFTRRSSEGFRMLDAASSDFTDLFAFLVKHAEEFRIDVNNLGLWVCSAGGPVCLSSILRSTKIPVRSIAALYPLMNLEHIEDLRSRLDAPTRARFSPLMLLEEKPAQKLPPLLIVRAGLDKPIFNDSIDEFIQKALIKNMEIMVVNHPDGHHAFDIRDDNGVSQGIIEQVLQFFREHASLGEDLH